MTGLPTALSFATPIWFWALLLLLPILVLRLWSHFSSAKQLPGLVSPRLHALLISGGSQARRWAVFVFHCLAMVATITALARPQLGFDEVPTETEARNLILAIDTSRSMLANDLQPDRLSRAKLAAMDIIRSLPEDRIGLIAFAGRPFLQAPLTVDHEAVLESVDQLDTEIIPRGGTNLTAAVNLALETFQENETAQSALVLFSDGEALEGMAEVESIRNSAKEAGMSILTVGVGTASGAIIPELDDLGKAIPGQFVKDESGQVVRSRLDPEALRALASDGGVYIHLGGKASLTQVVNQIQSGIATSREESESQLRPIERFMWPLSIAAICLIFAHIAPLLFRPSASRVRSTLLVANGAKTALAFLVLSGSLVAGADDALFLGHEHFEKENYEEAISVYEGALSEGTTKADTTRLQMGIGSSAFRQGDFERASEAYGQALVDSKPGIREQAHYNLGNTLFRQGESALKSLQKPANPDQVQTMSAPAELIQSTIATWEGAIEHYESALSLNEQNQRAQHNIEVVRRKIEELKKQQEEQEQEQEQEQEEEKKEQEEEEKEDEKEEKEDEEESDDQKDKEEQDQKEDQEPSSDEEKSDQENEKDEEGQQPKEDEKNEEENDSEKENDQDSKDSDSEDSKEGGKDPKENEGKPEKSEQGQPENAGEEPPRDGDLESSPDQKQPQNPQQQPGQTKPVEQRNPETGYSPTEARQLLKALADETEVRPILKPVRGEKFKNW